MLAVDGRGFGYEPHALLAVFSDVFLGARPDEVDFEVGEVAAAVVVVGVVGVVAIAAAVDRAAAGEVPVVDVVGPEVLYAS
jgi:formate hydrogenlyase subunit 4